MRINRIIPGVAGVFAGLFSLGVTGCVKEQSRGPALIGRSEQPARSSVVLGQPQEDSKIGSFVQRIRKPIAAKLEEPVELSRDKRCQVHLALGQMLESTGKLGDAQQQYEQALKAEPKSLSVTLALARVYARMGRPDAATKVYDQAERHHRKHAALFNDKGLLLAEQKQWPKAVATLQKAVKLEPSNSKYHNNLGMALAASGSYQEAWNEFRDAVGPGPAHYNVAYMLVRSGRTDEARTHLVQALADMPSLTEANTLLAQLNGTPSSPVTPEAPTVTAVEEQSETVAVSYETPSLMLNPDVVDFEPKQPETPGASPVARPKRTVPATDDGTELVPVSYDEPTGDSPARSVISAHKNERRVATTPNPTLAQRQH